jgi:hypothetical protein
MDVSRFKLIYIFLGLTLVLYQNCGDFSPNHVRSASTLTSEDEIAAYSVEEFSKTLQPLLLNSCAGCHGIFQQPLFAVDNSTVAHDLIIARQLVDLDEPTSSYFVQKIRGGHSGYGMDMSDQILQQIEIWSRNLQGRRPSVQVPTTEVEDVEFAKASAESVISKVKFLIHGGAPTSNELQLIKQAREDQRETEELKDLLDEWLESPEAERKLHAFFRLTLQQTSVLGSYANSDQRNLFGIVSDTEDQRLRNNLQDTFVNTTLNLIKEGRPFNEVLNTKRWQVTTATLSMLAFMDNRRAIEGEHRNTTDLRVGATLGRTGAAIDSDFNDWRWVTFERASDNESPAHFTDLAHWRNVQDGDIVRFASLRSGFFNAPMFLGRWQTNPDNDFRILTNQTLIVALNQTFNMDDTTPSLRPLSVLDSPHSQPGTACLQCHRLLDPLRDVWSSEINRNYRPDQFNYRGPADFVFMGRQATLNNVEDFASQLAQHPQFAVGWVQKACDYFNSQKCDASDGEFQKVVTAFRASNLDFKVMLKHLLSSPIVTGSEQTLTHTKKNFIVSMTRQNHFCQSITVRYRELQKKYTHDLIELDDGARLCRLLDRASHLRRHVGSLLNGIPNDEMARGEVDILITAQPSIFYAQASQKICQQVAGFFAPIDNTQRNNIPTQYPANQSSATEAVAKEFITDYVTHFLGVPEGHSRHEKLKEALHTYYDRAYAESTLTNVTERRRLALNQVFEFGCELPELLSVGL